MPEPRTDDQHRWGWHVIGGDTLMRMLRRCHEGEDPELVYVEEYANAERHEHG